jgi:hypothetical protein
MVIGGMGLSTIILGKSVGKKGEEIPMGQEGSSYEETWGQQEGTECWSLEATMVYMLEVVWIC